MGRGPARPLGRPHRPWGFRRRDLPEQPEDHPRRAQIPPAGGPRPRARIDPRAPHHGADRSALRPSLSLRDADVRPFHEGARGPPHGNARQRSDRLRPQPSRRPAEADPPREDHLPGKGARTPAGDSDEGADRRGGLARLPDAQLGAPPPLLHPLRLREGRRRGQLRGSDRIPLNRPQGDGGARPRQDGRPRFRHTGEGGPQRCGAVERQGARPARSGRRLPPAPAVNGPHRPDPPLHLRVRGRDLTQGRAGRSGDAGRERHPALLHHPVARRVARRDGARPLPRGSGRGPSHREGDIRPPGRRQRGVSVRPPLPPRRARLLPRPSPARAGQQEDRRGDRHDAIPPGRPPATPWMGGSSR